MSAEPGAKSAVPLLQSREGLPAFAAIAVASAGVFAFYGPTTLSMVDIWLRSETFTHGFLVLPAFYYFVWTRRGALASVSVQPFWPGLLAVLAAGLLWLLAQLAGVIVVAQFAEVAMVPAVILTLFGTESVRLLAFPCAFLLFAVPFGEAFVPTLIQWTADFTVSALRLSGVPVYREGASFVVPSGRWSVVEACSGIRYLIAAAMSGTLFAWLMYRSPWRRAAFIVASLVVPVVANWVRAYGIVMLGHLSDNRIATGVDHVIYGWLFFGFVITALFAMGARWRDRVPSMDEVPLVAGVRAARSPSHGDGSGRKLSLAATAALTAVWPLLYIELGSPIEPAPLVTLEAKAVAGWERAPAFTEWRANTRHPAMEEIAYFRKDADVVGLQLAVYRNQSERAKLVTTGNQLVDSARRLDWHVTSERRESPDTGADKLAYRETVLAADKVLAARDWYWLGGPVTTSDVYATAHLAITRLLRHDDTSAWVIVFTPVADHGVQLQAAQAVLDRFRREMGPSIEAALRGER